MLCLQSAYSPTPGHMRSNQSTSWSLIAIKNVEVFRTVAPRKPSVLCKFVGKACKSHTRWREGVRHFWGLGERLQTSRDKRTLVHSSDWKNPEMRTVSLTRYWLCTSGRRATVRFTWFYKLFNLNFSLNVI